MIWLSWRQFRVQAIVAGAALVVVAIALAATGPHLAALFDNNGLATCRAHCSTDASNFINQAKRSSTYQIGFFGGIFLMYAVPALIGIFWGAPLVARELESGTFRLAWNQSVPRSRWIAVKLGLIGLAAMATTGLLSLMTSWWARPIFQAAQKAGQNGLSVNKLTPPFFGATGIAPVGYAAFAFALGVTSGVHPRHLRRRAGPHAAGHPATPDPADPADRPIQRQHGEFAHDHLARQRNDRGGELQPAGCLDPVGPDDHPIRPCVHRPRHQHMPQQHGSSPGVPELAERPALASADHLPALEPVLATAVA
jgi:hypothetical protein